MALAAQGFGAPRPKRVGAGELGRLLRRLALIQLDYVNVVTPAHFIVPYSRLGPYRAEALSDLVYRRRKGTEAWAHEASLVPMETWALLAYRRRNHPVRPRGLEPFLRREIRYVASILGEIRARGPLAAHELPGPEHGPRKIDGAWIGTVPRAVLELHFGRGALAVVDRRPDFSRVYDLVERVVPDEIRLRDVPDDAAKRELLLRAARAHGIATAGDLADYWRMKVGEARPHLDALEKAGELEKVRVRGWRQSAYLVPGAKFPESVTARALVAPFDPLIWTRGRARRVFGLDYRLEIFIPEKKRRWGCYVLPFLLGDRFVARVDLKAERDESRLVVRGAFAEPGVDEERVAKELAAELGTMAKWLELGGLRVESRGDLSESLARAVDG